jgi:tetratricopeptide (TPR) repeat protein
VLLELATVAKDQQDVAKAKQLVDEAQVIYESVNWTLEHQLKYLAPIATLRFEIGDAERANADIEEALTRYENEKDSMATSFHAEALRPLAEAYVASGDQDRIYEMYNRTLEAGLLNKNNRPRCVNLVATCCSMAVHGVKPTDAMLERMHAISEGLDEQW